MTDPVATDSHAAPAPQGGQVQLLELGAHFALAEKAAHMGYWRQEIGSVAPHWSPGFFAIMGLDPEGVRPSTEYMAKRIHPDERVMVAQKIAEALATGQPFHYRTQTWYGGGPIRYYDTHGDVERGPDGNITALLGVVREVTEEVEANRRLQESESTYRFMTDEATDIITRHGPQGVPVFISPAIEQILGYKPAEILGTMPFQRAHPDDLESARASIMEAKATGRTVSYTHRSRHKLGHFVWLESRVRFVSNPLTGERDTAISVTRDISIRKQFEEDLLRAREKAEAASHTKSRFLANMSH
jgi:PAS domain S-box-containing protein